MSSVLGKEVSFGKVYENELSALSKGKFEALPQRGEVLYRKVRVRPEELSPGTTWSGSEKVLGLRDPASGKTESEKDIWRSRKSIP